MVPVYLIGGGGDHPQRAETYGRFLRAATLRSRRLVVLVATSDEADEAVDILDYYREIFAVLGARDQELSSLSLSPGNALDAGRLSSMKPTGVFVCGGSTPLYQEALCRDRAWVDYLRTKNIPYAGVSAGAAVAATAAIVGGWQAQRGGNTRSILFQGASEGLDLLDVRPGLGLVPFAVEVHASQWGTLTRLIHALDLGLASEGWALDENTLLQVGEAGIEVHGPGHAYHLVRTAESGIQVSVHTGGAAIQPEG